MHLHNRISRIIVTLLPDAVGSLALVFYTPACLPCGLSPFEELQQPNSHILAWYTVLQAYTFNMHTPISISGYINFHKHTLHEFFALSLTVPTHWRGTPPPSPRFPLTDCNPLLFSLTEHAKWHHTWLVLTCWGDPESPCTGEGQWNRQTACPHILFKSGNTITTTGTTTDNVSGIVIQVKLVM